MIQKEEEQERHLVLTRKLREEIREIADRNRAEVVTMETQHKVRCYNQPDVMSGMCNKYAFYM